MNIKTKITLGAAIGALLSIVGVGAMITYVAEKSSTESLKASGQQALISSRNAKKTQVEDYFKTIHSQLATYSNNKMVIDATRDFTNAFDMVNQEIALAAADTENPQPAKSYSKLRDYYTGPFTNKYKELNNGEDPIALNYYTPLDERTLKLQDLYIAQNTNPLGAKDAQIAAKDGSLYSSMHKKYHPYIRSFLQEFGYYDIFLVNNKGDIIYSVFKELDYATNLVSGPYSNTGIAEAFRKSESASLPENTVNTIDFADYYPSYNGAASFFSSPIYDGNKKLGVLIMQAPVDRLNALMTSNNKWKEVGLGDSGETYIVGSDNKLRNDSRFLIEDKAGYISALQVAGDPNVNRILAKGTSIGLQGADTIGTKEALKGNEGFSIFPDYRGVPVLSAYTPLEIPGLNWALMSEIDEEEAFRPIEAMKSDIISKASLIGLGALALFGLGAFGLIRSITKPLSQLTGTINEVAEGDMTARSKLSSNDELEELGNAFDGMLDDRIATMEEAARTNKQLNESVVELMNATSQLADRDLTIEVPVAEDVTGTVSDALNMMVEETSDVLIEINKVSKQVEDSVNLVQSQTTAVKGAADNDKIIIQNTIDQLNKVSGSIQNIGGLVQQVSKLANNVQESSTTTANTVNKNIEGMGQIRETVGETEKRIKRLGERSQEIGNIVDIINTLSERTNVLALNASMQAASAGEAGKGFAVVAEEVQRLSESSRESTLEISSLIDSIQLETSEAISTMASTIETVLEGAELAGQAGTEMTKTQADAVELAKAIERISLESQAQTEANAALMTQANTVLDSTEKTSVALDEQSIQTTNLVGYAERLRSEVGSFKLPAH